MANTIQFRGQTVYLDEDPKRGVCNLCRYVVGEVHAITGEVYQRSHMHHEVYNENAPEDHIIETCPLCHRRAHFEGYVKREAKLIRVSDSAVKKIEKVQRPRESYGEVVERAMDVLLEKERVSLDNDGG
jgi:hypothetical protein